VRVERSILERAGLASGLLTEGQIDHAWQVLVESLPEADLSLEEISDDQLAGQLVALGYLNRWQAEQLRLGRTRFKLGAYRILDAIGYGGMGWVFKCEHVLLGRVEAVKVLPKSQTNPVSIANFLREIRAQAYLDHPNLVRLTYADSDGETYFLVTEFVPGADLRKIVHQHGPFTLEQSALIVTQAAEALAYAHRRGLIHRDIKPGNLLITPEGRTKLTDLGLAWFYSEEKSTKQSRPKQIVGTADYIAPEIVVTPGVIRPVSDIYSLGCTLYYAVTGKVPFPGGDTADKLRRQLDVLPIAPQKLNPEVTPEFSQIISAMMQKRPEDRVQTAEQVIEMLRPWAEAIGIEGQQQIGALTALDQSASQDALLADTLPDIHMMGDTQDRQEDSTDRESSQPASLPQAFSQSPPNRAAPQSLVTPIETPPQETSGLSWVLKLLVGLALLTTGAAVYLVLRSV